MEWTDVWLVAKPLISLAVFVLSIVLLLKRFWPAISRMQKGVQDAQGLPKEERTRHIHATRDTLLEEHLSQDLYKNFLSTLVVVILTVPLTILMGFYIIRAALRGVHFFPFYILLACAVFITPILIITLIDLTRLVIKKRKEKKF